MRAAIAAILALLADPVLASNLRLQSPIDCTPGADCFVQQYMDHDPGPGAVDYKCGALVYEGNNGTDFSLPDLAAMERGVTVRAAAGGTVKGARDGMPDIAFTPSMASEINGRECGNGVVIEHFDGWETQYCHLKRGSVTVRTGDRVSVGDKLGDVGLSGQTEFPHLHLSVRHKGKHIDPFAPSGVQSCQDAEGQRPLWIDPPEYLAGGIISVGFSDGLPDFDAIIAGTASTSSLPTDAPAIVVYGHAYGGRTSDRMHLFLAGPAGTVVDHSETLSRDRARFFRAAGTRLRGQSWPKGAYRARVAIKRDGRLLDMQESILEIR